jgi:hypothetical protein
MLRPEASTVAQSSFAGGGGCGHAFGVHVPTPWLTEPFAQVPPGPTVEQVPSAVLQQATVGHWPGVHPVPTPRNSPAQDPIVESVHCAVALSQQAPCPHNTGVHATPTPWYVEPVGHPAGDHASHPPVVVLQHAPEHGLGAQVVPIPWKLPTHAEEMLEAHTPVDAAQQAPLHGLDVHVR